jgi:hypothetical protein
MGNPAGVRRDFDALEKRRFTAMRLLDKGLNQAEVARRVKVVRKLWCAGTCSTGVLGWRR